MASASGGRVNNTYAVLVALGLAACTPSVKDDIVEPVLDDGKGDIGDRVSIRGELVFTEASTGAFTEDLQFDGYRLALRAGAVVTIDNTHLGTASKLDSTLFVYGPRTAAGYGTAAIAFDDDSGWGAHARLRGLVVPVEGEYLVVLGSANARGRGQYRLEARCDSGACAPLPASATCDAALADGIAKCMAAQIGDGDIENDTTPTYAEALASCTDGESLGAVRDAACSSHPTAAYCGVGFEAFATSEVPACVSLFETRFGLCGPYLEDALDRASVDLWFLSESEAPYTAVRVAGAGAPTVAKVQTLAGVDASTVSEVADYDRVFGFRARDLEPDMDPGERLDVLRHRHLRRVLEDNLRSHLVVRLGLIQVQVYIVGESACGELAGYSTVSIET